jgi:hypothetical protein
MDVRPDCEHAKLGQVYCKAVKLEARPHTPSWRSAKLAKHRENFNFYPLDRRLGEPQNWYGRCVKKK